MTLEEIIRWFDRDVEDRVILFEIDHVVDFATSGPPVTHVPTTVSKRVSTTGYVTLQTDSPANTGYDSCVKDVPRFERSIDRQTLGGRGTMSVGSLVIDNQSGDYDDFLDLAADGSDVRCYIGSRSWPRADFIHMFTATTERIDAPDTNSIVVQLKDSLGLINASIATEFIGGTGPNKERAKPISLGLCHQVECILEDEATLLYRYGVEPEAIDVRDRGLSVAFVDGLDGTFTLSASPAGIITADILTTGGNAYGDEYQVSNIFKKIAGDYLLPLYPTGFYGNITPDTFPGPASTLFGPGDFQIGIRVEEKTNALDVLDKVAFSGIIFYTYTRDARLAYGRIHPSLIKMSTPDIVLTADDVKGDVKVEHNDPDYWNWYFYYNKNWHVMSQGDFAGAVSTDDQAKFSAKGVYGSDKPTRPGIESVISPDYYDQPSEYHKTMSVSQETETILSITDADDALDIDYPLGTRWFRRMRDIHFPWMEFVTITVGLKAFYLELGKVVLFNFPRYGFDETDPATGLQGAKFQLVGIDFQLTDNQIELVLFRQRGADVTPPYVHRGVGVIEGLSTVNGVSGTGSVANAAGTSTVIGITPGASVGFSAGTSTVTGVTGSTYTFSTDGGLYHDGLVDDLTLGDFIGPDSINTPAFWDIDPINIDRVLIHEDVVDAAVATPTSVLLEFGVSMLSYLMPFPAFMCDNSGIAQPFSTSSSVAFPNATAPNGQVIDYVTYDPGSGLDRMAVPVPAGPFSPGDDISIGPISVQTWRDFDYASAGVSISVSVMGFYGAPATTEFAYLSVNIHNFSGATITGLFGSSGASGMTVQLPTNAVDPDAPVGIEYDFSFVDLPNSTTASPAVCVAHDLGGGATIDSSSSDRHTLVLLLTTLTLVDTQHAQLIFPIKTFVAGLTGWSVPSIGSGVHFTPTLVSDVGVAPAATVKVFMEAGDLIITVDP